MFHEVTLLNDLFSVLVFKMKVGGGSSKNKRESIFLRLLLKKMEKVIKRAHFSREV